MNFLRTPSGNSLQLLQFSFSWCYLRARREIITNFFANLFAFDIYIYCSHTGVHVVYPTCTGEFVQQLEHFC